MGTKGPLYLLACGTALHATPAIAGSQTRPGFTTGVAVWQPLPEGIYLNSIEHYGVRNTEPESHAAAWTPYVFYQAPMQVLGGRVGVAIAPTILDGVNRGHHISGLYNTYFAGQIAWKISPDLSFGYRLGGYIPQHGGASNRFGTLEHRAGISYVHDGLNLTANLIYGLPGKDAAADRQIAPDYFNADLTATKRRGRWLLGAVAFASTDVSRPTTSYRKQSQFAAGPLVGYDLGPATVQMKLTSDLTEHHYGGHEQRLWFNILVPLWKRHS